MKIIVGIANIILKMIDGKRKINYNVYISFPVDWNILNEMGFPSIQASIKFGFHVVLYKKAKLLH